MFWVAKETEAPASDPLPPNRQLTAEVNKEKNIYTPGGGQITIRLMSAETLKIHRRKITLSERHSESSEWSSDSESSDSG